MTPGLVVKLRPTTPWRTGSDSGAAERVEPAYHSDSIFSAVTATLLALGEGEAWLEATVRRPGSPAVAFTSAFPFLREIRFIVPPKTVWPPSPSSRIRWKSARFLPIPVVEGLLRRKLPDDERWSVDGASGCLVPAGTRGPFRTALRSRAAIDRLNGGIEVHSRACLEFAPEAGLWVAAAFAGAEEERRWAGPVKAAFRVLADSGFGGGRSSGWGRAETPEFIEGELPGLIAAVEWPKTPERIEPAEGEYETPVKPESAYWLLSLFSPSPADQVDWNRGVYALLPRGGRVESPNGWGLSKKTANMIEEGSVLLAAGPPCGAAPDVAPDGFAHPVYRSGLAFSIPIPWHTPANHRAKPAPSKAPTAEPAPQQVPAPEPAEALQPAEPPEPPVEEPVSPPPVEEPEPEPAPAVEPPSEPPVPNPDESGSGPASSPNGQPAVEPEPRKEAE